MRPNNPIATAEQHAHELEALDLFRDPQLQATLRELRDEWPALARPSPTMQRCFAWAFEEVMFGAVVWALNQDPLYPRVITITRLPHRLHGQDIPGSRWGIDNPDSIYRVIPISAGERYRIRGRVHRQRLVENYFTLWNRDMATVGLLDGKDLEVDADDYFTISVDASPADGRRNHIQAPPDAHEFYIRDVIFDWANDRANELAIERLGPPPSRPPRTREEKLALAATYMRKWATSTTRWNQQALQKPANEFSFTIDRDTDGALRNQVYIMGHFRLPDRDTALVLDVDMGGADYFIAPITNVWGTTNDIVHRTGCLNKHQSRPNADGSYTFVLGLQDPAVHNWLDPGDLDEGILTLRWAEFAGGRPAPSLGVRARLVPLAQLPGHLPQVTPQQRAEQLRERAAAYAWRLADNTGATS